MTEKPWRLEGPVDPVTRKRPAARRFDTEQAARRSGTRTGWPSFTITGPDGEYVLGERVSASPLTYAVQTGRQGELFGPVESATHGG